MEIPSLMSLSMVMYTNGSTHELVYAGIEKGCCRQTSENLPSQVKILYGVQTSPVPSNQSAAEEWKGKVKVKDQTNLQS